MPSRKTSLFLSVCQLFVLSLLLWAEVPERVVTHVRFLDQSGHPVTDMAKEEVVLLEGGVEQEIAEFHPMDEPFQIGFIWDVSPSMRRTDLTEIRYNVREFLLNLPTNDPVLLITFDSDVYVDADWTLDRKSLDDVASYVGKYGGKDKGALFEALTLSIRQKFRLQSPRKAVVLLSDGHDSGSDGISKEDALFAVSEKGVLVYALQYDTRDHYRLLHGGIHRPMWEPPLGSTGRDMGGIFVGGGEPSRRDRAEYIVQSGYKTAREFMSALSRVGRGRHFEIMNSSALVPVLLRIEEELSSFYSLVHCPGRTESDSGFQNVSVQTKRKEVRVEQISNAYPTQ